MSYTLTGNMETKAADFSGTWKMKSSENFEELLKALGKSDNKLIVIHSAKVLDT